MVCSTHTHTTHCTYMRNIFININVCGTDNNAASLGLMYSNSTQQHTDSLWALLLYTKYTHKR